MCDVQTCGGERAGGFVANEFQEWFRLRVLPKIREIARQYFREHSKADWFNWSEYLDLCAAVGHKHTGIDPMFLVAQDSDSRHTMKYFKLAKDAKDAKKKGKKKQKHLPDRRDIPAGKEGHIPIDKKKNYLPTAPKVPDAVQFPVESCFAPVKGRYKGSAAAGECVRPCDMARNMEGAFAECATPERIRNCFRHGMENMRIFMGKKNETVTIGDTRYHCTHGGQLPGCRRG